MNQEIIDRTRSTIRRCANFINAFDQIAEKQADAISDPEVDPTIPAGRLLEASRNRRQVVNEDAERIREFAHLAIADGFECPELLRAIAVLERGTAEEIDSQMLEASIEFERIVGLQNPKGKRAPTVNERMRTEIELNPTSKRWSKRNWAKHLDCGPTTVGDTKTWQDLEPSRALRDAERDQRSKRE